MQRENSGAWLWCSKDDFMIDAIRKVGHGCCCQDCSVQHQSCSAIGCTDLDVMYLQMAKGNVGSLLVFDPAKIDFANDEQVKSAAKDAVVGIVTERGQHWVPGSTFAVHKTVLGCT